MAGADVKRTIEAVWRIESARLIAGLARIVRDVGLAEDLAQEALVAALEQWPRDGVPSNPGAWLMSTARNRGIDRIRHERMARGKLERLGREAGLGETAPERDLAAEIDDPFDDDLLRLVFTCCHPALSRQARVALTLRLLGGLSTAEIARAYLVPEATVAQRIVRAKRTQGAARASFEVPDRERLPERIDSVLEVVYLIFNEGYSPAAGAAAVRTELLEEALRLGRVLATLLPGEPEVHGLAALIELQASRTRARVGAGGAPVLLLDQDRARWDWLLVRRGLAALERAREAGGPTGPYALQAAIAACHARARRAEDTDWARIAVLYDALAAASPSPVVELNRAVAVGMAEGPERALAMIDAAGLEQALAGYPLLPAARAEMLQRLDRLAEARDEYERAAGLTANERQHALLLERAAGCARS